jgi:hypothetical protein
MDLDDAFQGLVGALHADGGDPAEVVLRWAAVGRLGLRGKGGGKGKRGGGGAGNGRQERKDGGRVKETEGG